MAFYDYIPGKKIDPSMFCEYCDGIVQNLENQSSAYVLVSESVDTFCNNPAYKGNAISGFQNQMSGYVTVLGALCYANEQDRLDIQTIKDLLSTVEEDKLDGTEIVDNIKIAEKSYNDNCYWAGYWNDCADSAGPLEFLYEKLCRNKAKSYENAASVALEEQKEWEGKARLLINIDCTLTGLFINGNSTRNLAKSGLDSIATAFDVDKGVYLNLNCSWMSEIKNQSILCIVDEAGKINWNMVEQILSKDADAISDYEYEMLAYAYVNAGLDEIERFFLACGRKGPRLAGRMDVFYPNKEKINNIIRQTNIIESNLLILACSDGLTKEQIESLEEKRNRAIQYMVLMGQFGSMNSYFAVPGENYFSFKEINFGFHEDPGKGIEFTYANMFSGDNHRPEPFFRSIRISEPLPDGYLATYKDEYLNKKLNGFNTSGEHIVFSDSVEFAVEQVATGKYGKALLKAGADYIPYVGFAYSMVMDLAEEGAHQAQTRNTLTMDKIVDIGNYFGCTGVIVDGPGDGFSVELFQGPDTRFYIDTYQGNTGIDASDVFKDPTGVFDKILEHQHSNPDYRYYERLFDTPNYSED